MNALTILLAVLGLALASAGWALLQKWTGRFAGEDYPGTDADDVGRCGSCGKRCRED
jgi:hypothetical protein